MAGETYSCDDCGAVFDGHEGYALHTRLDCLEAQRDAARAEVAEADAALDEAGEPRDDGEEALSLASRIRNLAEDRDGARTRADDLDAMVRDEQRLARGLNADIARLTAERDAAVAERDALRERVEAGIAECSAQRAHVGGYEPMEAHERGDAVNDAIDAIRAALEGK